jgi:hypothetical protein
MRRPFSILCCLMFFSVAAFAQNLQADLKKHFNRFSVVKINNQDALLKAKTGVPFNIQADERIFEFVLSANDMRSADYKSEYTDKDGRKTEPKNDTVTTYKGKLTGQSGSIVRMFLDGTKIEGFISTQERQDYFFEPAKNYSSWANSDELVIYQAKDKINNPVINLGLDELITLVKSGVDKQARVQFVKTAFAHSPSLLQATIKSIKVATDADTGFVLANGGVSGARSRIGAVLSIVDGIYERDLNLSLIHSYAHFWKGSDPYGTLTDLALLQAFRDYWNTNYPQTSFPRNVAHLFSDNYNAGFAYRGAICKVPSDAYSVNYYPDSSVYYSIMAHEIGHNLGAQHTSDPRTGCQEAGCENTLMQAEIQIGVDTFCPFSINEITNYYRPFYDPNEPEGLLCSPTLR